MKLFRDSVLHKWCIISGIITLIFLAGALHTYFSSIHGTGSLGDQDYNLDVIREVVNYDNVPASSVDEAPAKGARFLIVQNRQKGGRHWELIFQSDYSLDKQQWTPEDVRGFDYLVIVESSFDKAQYRSATGNESFIASAEKAVLKYYDIAQECVVYTKQMSRGLPSTKSDKYDYTFKNDDIITNVCEQFGFRYQTTFEAIFPYIMMIVPFLITVFTSREWIRRRRAGRKAAGEGD